MTCLLTRPLLALLSAVSLLMLVAACGEGESDQTESHIQTAEDVAQRLGDFQATAGVHVLGRTADIPDPPPGMVALRFGFYYPSGALPGDGLVVYEASSEVNSLWAMESLAKGQPVPAGDVLADQVVFMEPGEKRTVTLVFRNPTTEDVGFIALPHQESPGELGPKTWLTCFCMAFVWEAPAEGAWYRVIEVATAPDTPVGSKIDATWMVETNSAVFPDS